MRGKKKNNHLVTWGENKNLQTNGNPLPKNNLVTSAEGGDLSSARSSLKITEIPRETWNAVCRHWPESTFHLLFLKVLSVIFVRRGLAVLLQQFFEFAFSDGEYACGDQTGLVLILAPSNTLIFGPRLAFFFFSPFKYYVHLLIKCNPRPVNPQPNLTTRSGSLTGYEEQPRGPC